MGIIGVVAAITIPALVSKYETAQYRSAFKKTFGVISQAYRKMLSDCNAIDYGQLSGTACGANPGYNTTGIMLYHFRTYFNTSEVSNNGSLWTQSCKTLQNIPITLSGSPNESSFILNDGTTVLLNWAFSEWSAKFSVFFNNC